MLLLLQSLTPRGAGTLVACIIVLYVGLISSSAAARPAGGARWPADAGGNATALVAVDLYGEALCPDTKHAVLDVLAPMLASGFGPALRLRYVAAGKTRAAIAGGGIACQHGALECRFNRFVNCAQRAAPQEAWFSYARCLHEHPSELEAAAPGCAAAAGIAHGALAACAEGGEGAALEAAAVAETDGLATRLTFVPWILVEGVALGAAFEALDRVVCVAAAAKGVAPLPAACGSMPARLAQMG